MRCLPSQTDSTLMVSRWRPFICPSGSKSSRNEFLSQHSLQKCRGFHGRDQLAGRGTMVVYKAAPYKRSIVSITPHPSVKLVAGQFLFTDCLLTGSRCQAPRAFLIDIKCHLLCSRGIYFMHPQVFLFFFFSVKQPWNFV